MVPEQPSLKLMPTMALLDTQHVEMLNVQLDVKFKPVAQLET
jgi:hypothetical protein